jgi:hypothetical protein
MKNYIFYIDDSGTRHPDARPSNSEAQYDWFGLGGVIVAEDDAPILKQRIQDFKASWDISCPLHSHPIRTKKDDFSWMKFEQDRGAKFLSELGDLILTAPVVGHGCVIDRPSYDRRYVAVYGRNRWSLCKTTFSIAVERAAKYVHSLGGRMRVYVERSGAEDERMLKSYYDGLKKGGTPFDAGRSAAYSPLDKEIFQDVLYELKFKNKSSPIMQLADLYLYPICLGGYNPTYRPYVDLCRQKKLIDQNVAAEDVNRLGIKYSCFERVPGLARQG